MKVPDSVLRAELDRIAAARAQAMADTVARFESPRLPGVIAAGFVDEAERFFEAREAELLRESASMAAREVA